MLRLSQAARLIVSVAFIGGAALAPQAFAQAPAAAAPAPAAGPDEMGKYTDKDGNPTFNVKPDGNVDWFTFSGFKRYHSECHVCHGPEGKGSSYAPALVESVQRLSYDDFNAVIIQGRKKVGASENSVMPSFGTNVNVACFIDDLWVYLRAASLQAIPPGRPNKKDAKTPAYAEYENSCLGLKK